MTSANASVAADRHLGFLDPIRVLLTVLVIAHHTSITYGGAGDWYYKEAGAPEWVRLLLSVFTATNQAHFMGFFFLLAGYFTPGALVRKGTGRFALERVWRLGVPLLLYAALLSPLTRALASAAHGNNFITALAGNLPPRTFEPGPLWFCIALLLFSAAWLIVIRVPGLERLQWPSANPHVVIALAVVGCGVLAFAIRLAVPVGRTVHSLQLGYFASYLLLLYGGCAMASGRLLERVEWRHARPWVLVAAVVFPLLWIYAALGGAFEEESWRGGWSLPAAAYALWEPPVAAGIILACLAGFRRYMPAPGPLWRRLAADSFTAFVIHPPVVVACCALVQPISDAPLVRFVCVVPLASVLTFALADAWRALLRWPRARMAAMQPSSLD